MKEFLLDTHILIWAATETKKNSPKVNAILEDIENTIYVNLISFWEISLKYAKGSLNLGKHRPEDFPYYCIEMGFRLINLNENLSSSIYQLTADYHRDPFDRMLIWQAIQNNFTLITDDKYIKMYQSEGLKTLW